MDELIAAERAFWQASTSGDAGYYEEHMADDAVVVFGSMGALDKRTCVAAVRAAGESWKDFSIDDVRTVHLTPDSAVVTYRADATPAGETEAKKYLGSSAYVRRGGKWLIAFHQQTPDTR